MPADSKWIEPRFNEGMWNSETDPLPSGKIQIWYFDISETGRLAGLARSILVPQDSAQAEKFLRREPLEKFVIRRSLLRCLLGLHTGRSLYRSPLEYSASGQPLLPAGEKGLRPLFFSVSHTGGDLLFAFSKSWPAGVDIEEIRPVKELQSMIRKSCSAEEMDRINKVPEAERAGAFYKVWTLKEAISKAAGSGLTVEILRNSADEAFHQYHFTLFNRLAGAVAAHHPVRRFLWRTCSAEVMLCDGTAQCQ